MVRHLAMTTQNEQLTLQSFKAFNQKKTLKVISRDTVIDSMTKVSSIYT